MTTAQERKQHERHVRRRRIQRAAREVFAEKGYAKTSIEQVARQASLSVGAIYLYFRSKEDLYVSLLEETLELFDAELTQVRNRHAAADARLQATWSYLAQWAATDVEGTRILRLVSQPGVRAQLSDEVIESVGKGIAHISEHMAALITEGMTGGIYRRGDATEVAELLWALFVGVLQTADAKTNLGLTGPAFADASRAAFEAIEASLRNLPRQVAHAA
jgi:TetR/AcrR family transcriptional regulator